MCGRRMDVEDDRISSLPDDLLHKILSFISIHEAIKTSFLSRRWRNLWTSIPYLNFLNEDFRRHGFHFSDFVLDALSRLNNQIQVSSFKLIGFSRFSHVFYKRIVHFAASHNVKQLTIMAYTLLPATWELPALTTLYLHGITLTDKHQTTDPKGIGLISKCTNLKNFTLSEFKVKGRTKVLNIFHPQLSTLTIEYAVPWVVDVFNVVTPQLKNLNIRYYSRAKYMISAPELTSLMLNGLYPVELSTEGFPFLEKLNLQVFRINITMMACLLQHLHTVKFLILNLEVLERLSSSTVRISRQSCAFPNWKMSKFLASQKGKVYMEAQEKVVTMTAELKSQDTSPSAIFTVVSCEEIKVMRRMVLARELIEELIWLMVKLRKENGYHMMSCKRKRGKVQVKKQCVQSEFEMQWHFGEMMAQIEQEKIDGILAYNFPILKTRKMISSLQCIARLVTELPASKRSVLQVAFTSLCEEAAILMNNYVMDGMKN